MKLHTDKENEGSMAVIPRFSSPSSSLFSLDILAKTPPSFHSELSSSSQKNSPPGSSGISPFSAAFSEKHHLLPSVTETLPYLSTNTSKKATSLPAAARRSSITARISPCYVSNSHSLLNSTIWFYDHQPRGDTWPYGTVTLGKTGCLRYEAPNGGLHIAFKHDKSRSTTLNLIFYSKIFSINIIYSPKILFGEEILIYY